MSKFQTIDSNKGLSHLYLDHMLATKRLVLMEKNIKKNIFLITLSTKDRMAIQFLSVNKVIKMGLQEKM